MAEDVRRRRAERVRQQRAKTMLSRNKWPIIGGAVVLALVATVVAFPGIIPQGPPAAKSAHEHPAFLLMIEGQEVSFNDPAYDLQRGVGGGKVHMHYAGPGEPTKMNTWHVEGRFPGGIPDVTLQTIFLQYQVQFAPGALKLDTLDGHNGTSWLNQGNRTWRVFVSSTEDHRGSGREDPNPPREPFRELTDDYTKYMPRNWDQILITYGNLSPEEIARQQALVPQPRE